jgi:FkbM family methyltransferase
MVMPLAHTGLKRLRSFTPLNALVTHGVRSAFARRGGPSEWAVMHLPHVGVTNARLPNGAVARFWSRGDDWVPNQVFWRGWAGYEPEASALFFTLASAARVTVDVGAHVGFHSVIAALANPQGRVFALEPLSIVFARLHRNLLLSDATNVEPVQAAAGAIEGEADFFHVQSAIPCSSSLSQGFMRALSDVTSTRVPVVRLDRLLDEARADRVDLMKLDTETTEPDVLRGMGARLGRDRPDIFCEVLPTADGDALTALLQEHGYRFFLLTDAGPVERRTVSPDPRWHNHLFTVRQTLPLPVKAH